jgi:hypothetical protein
MKSTTVKLYNYNLAMLKTYLVAAIFIAGNILLPQVAHLIPQGGLIFLPIYFFTLVAAYKYGLKVGLLTAIFSPLINHLLFGMPMAAILPILLIKSSLLAIAVAVAAKYFKNVNIIGILLAIIAYQILGGVAEWALTGDITAALQDFKLGYPGLLFQLFGGYFALKAIEKI